MLIGLSSSGSRPAYAAAQRGVKEAPGEGIGRAIARALAREGASVGLIARTRADLEAVAAELAGSGARTSLAVADVASRQEAEAAVASIRAGLGPIDILVDNAGTAQFGTVLEMDPEVWERIVRVNLLGTYHVTLAVLPDMVERRSGDVVNVAATAGEKGSARASAPRSSSRRASSCGTWRS